MQGELTIRKTRTASGAKAVQVVRYDKGKCIIIKHIGSAHTQDELAVLLHEAQRVREKLCIQPSLFAGQAQENELLHAKHLSLKTVTHCFAHKALRNCSQQCGLGSFHPLYQDLALMRILEPASKLRTIELLKRYFDISYAQRSVYRLLPQLITHKHQIQKAAYQTARTHFGESFSLIFYDVTTLYFESHEPDDELKARGFSKDNKSLQPQIVVGLLVTSQGFPLMHELYKGNTFEGHTMLSVVKHFQTLHEGVKPIIVADSAMLSKENMELLGAEGYRYIVGARLANAPNEFITKVVNALQQKDGQTVRLAYPKRDYSVICSYCQRRAKKDHWEFAKQLKRAQQLIESQEPGKRAKFVKKSKNDKEAFVLNEQLKNKTEKLLGIKGYCTNIAQEELSNDKVVNHYHELWRIEQCFRMSKSDLRTRPIFHYTHEAIEAHVVLCFMALMMGKFLEIKTGLSLQRIRDLLWSVHEAHIEDTLTGKHLLLQTNLADYNNSQLANLLGTY